MKLLFSTAKDVKKEKEKEKSEKTKQNKLTNSQGCKKITNSFHHNFQESLRQCHQIISNSSAKFGIVEKQRNFTLHGCFLTNESWP